jgi:putative aldouronate transport system substrate-binding protein
MARCGDKCEVKKCRITGQYTGGYGENVIAALINAFIFYNKGDLSLDSAGNKVIAPFTEPAFRQALIYLNDLYKEGVLDPGIFTNNQQQFRSTINAEPMTVGFLSFGSGSNFDAAWNAYLRELDNLGLQQWVAMAQSAYNRQR